MHTFSLSLSLSLSGTHTHTQPHTHTHIHTHAHTPYTRMAAQVLNDECYHDSGGKTTLTHTSTLVFVGAFFLFLTLPLSALFCVCVCVSVCLFVCRALSVCCSFPMYSPPVCSALCMRVSVCLCVCLGSVSAFIVSFSLSIRHSSLSLSLSLHHSSLSRLFLTLSLSAPLCVFVSLYVSLGFPRACVHVHQSVCLSMRVCVRVWIARVRERKHKNGGQVAKLKITGTHFFTKNRGQC